MYSGITEDLKEKEYDLLKGGTDFGDGMMAFWDFTGGLTKEQWVFQKRLKIYGELFLTKNGRVLCPSMGIY